MVTDFVYEWMALGVLMELRGKCLLTLTPSLELVTGHWSARER